MLLSISDNQLYYVIKKIPLKAATKIYILISLLNREEVHYRGNKTLLKDIKKKN